MIEISPSTFVLKHVLKQSKKEKTQKVCTKNKWEKIIYMSIEKEYSEHNPFHVNNNVTLAKWI